MSVQRGQGGSREGLHVSSTEGERSILLGLLLAGATWTAGRAAGQAIMLSDRSPFGRKAPEAPLLRRACRAAHVWECPCWESARRTWMPWVLLEARVLLALPAA